MDMNANMENVFKIMTALETNVQLILIVDSDLAVLQDHVLITVMQFHALSHRFVI